MLTPYEVKLIMTARACLRGERVVHVSETEAGAKRFMADLKELLERLGLQDYEFDSTGEER